MQATEVDGEAGKVLSGLRTSYSSCQFPDANGFVVMDASLFGCLQLRLVTIFKPLSGYGLITESDGPNSAGGVAVFAGFAARRVGTQQAAGCFFLDMHFCGHGGRI
jgi:hypothetical protein